jgi:hypothetical protein
MGKSKKRVFNALFVAKTISSYRVMMGFAITVKAAYRSAILRATSHFAAQALGPSPLRLRVSGWRNAGGVALFRALLTTDAKSV